MVNAFLSRFGLLGCLIGVNVRLAVVGVDLYVLLHAVLHAPFLMQSATAGKAHRSAGAVELVGDVVIGVNAIQSGIDSAVSVCEFVLKPFGQPMSEPPGAFLTPF